MKNIINSLKAVLSVLVISLFGVGSVALAATYTTTDVSSHKTALDCWQIVNGNVYNLASFLSSNPTGPISSANCGTDVSTGINGGQNPISTINQLNPYLIGTIGQASTLTTTKVTPNSLSLAIGATKELSVSTLDQNSSPIAGNLSFTSSNPAVATVSNFGLVTGVSAGTTTITVKGTSLVGSNNASGTVTVTVSSTGSTNNNAPVISGITAPTVLNVGEVGTWSVQASDPQNGSLSYAVDWGETSMALMSASMNNFVQTTSFTHSYANTGTYTVKFTVKNAAGQTAVSTVTVNVVSGGNNGGSSSQLGSIALVANDYEVDVGGTQQMTVIYKDQNENPFSISGVKTTYTSSNTAVATVDANGLVTGVAKGTATITATSVMGTTSVSDTALMTVTPGYEGNSQSMSNQVKDYSSDTSQSNQDQNSQGDMSSNNGHHIGHWHRGGGDN